MKTGARFWQLVGLVFFILGAYGLAELYDAVQAKQKQLDSQQQLALKQRALLHDNHWTANLAAIDSVRQAWLMYLPQEDSVAVAKAHMLNDMRTLAQNAGMTNLSITATEVEDNEKGSAGSALGNNAHSANGFASSARKSEADALPAGVQLIKVKLAGRFNPAAFTQLLDALGEERWFAVIERASVRGAQMELNLRCYWRMNTSKTTAKPENPDAPLIAAAH